MSKSPFVSTLVELKKLPRSIEARQSLVRIQSHFNFFTHLIISYDSGKACRGGSTSDDETKLEGGQLERILSCQQITSRLKC